MILETRQELKLNLVSITWLPNDESIQLGFKMYATLLHDPDENRQLFLFFESLLMEPSLTTVVAATVNNLGPKLVNGIRDFTAMNMWFKALDARYSFSLGPTIVALSSTEQLEELAKTSPPYLSEYQRYMNSVGQEGRECDLSGKMAAWQFSFWY